MHDICISVWQYLDYAVQSRALMQSPYTLLRVSERIASRVRCGQVKTAAITCEYYRLWLASMRRAVVVGSDEVLSGVLSMVQYAGRRRPGRKADLCASCSATPSRGPHQGWGTRCCSAVVARDGNPDSDRMAPQSLDSLAAVNCYRFPGAHQLCRAQ